jgi:hypothetical protein
MSKVRSRKFAPTSGSSEEYDPGEFLQQEALICLTNISLESGLCSIDFYMAAKDPYRVAPGNKIPVPWPYHMSRASDDAVAIADAVQNDYKKVLADFSINLQDTRVRGLCPRGYFEPQDTLIINTHDEDFHRWKEAATVIQWILDSATSRRDSGHKLRVEIRNDTKLFRDVSSIIKPNSLAHKACMQVESAVYEKVKQSCPGQWRIISYHMRGPALQPADDRKPTIMVGIVPGARSFWALIEHQIIETVESANSLSVKLHVELVPGCVVPCISLEMQPPPPHILRDLPENPSNGSSIGPRGATNAGSLGVWVDFQPRGSTEKQRCFLTCHHVISPGDPANRSFNDHHGIALEGYQGQKRITIDYPAAFDATATKEKLQREIEQGNHEDGRSAQTINTINKYVSAGGIGSVIHASGWFRKNSRGRRMDWAIVRVHRPNASQSNKPPAATFSPRELWFGNKIYNVKSDEVISKIGTTEAGEWVAKVGRGGVRAAEVNAMNSVAYWENGTESKEIDIAGLEDIDFADPGDSGSMVINLNKEWVGILVGKVSYDNSGIVTSAQDVIDDIKAQTGGSISLV